MDRGIGGRGIGAQTALEGTGRGIEGRTETLEVEQRRRRMDAGVGGCTQALSQALEDRRSCRRTDTGVGEWTQVFEN